MGKIKVYKQYDSRWSRKNYNGSSSIGAAACGAFAPTNVLNVPEGNDIKPMDVVKFMQKNHYAVYNHGTAWSGIPAALKHFGAEDVRGIDISSSMTNAWGYLKDGYEAVLLFSAGKRGGVCWTTQGHYVGVAKYKFKDGKHWMYTMDSGGRDHDGWYCYEKHMRGLLPKMWVAKVPKITPKKKDDDKPTKPTRVPNLPQKGYFAKGDRSSEVSVLQTVLSYLGFSCGEVDGIFGGLTKTAVGQFQKKYGLGKDYKWGKECNAKAKALLKLT